MDAKKEAERQLALLERGCEEIVPRDGLLAKLERSVRTGIPLRVKLGIDPTSKNVHLGHMVPYGKLRQFQDLGHVAVLVIGDYTASIGDPSGRNAERPPLTLEAVRENAETYAEQIFRVVDRERAEMRRQSEWYGALSLAETLSLAGSFSLAHMLSHETFRQRYEGGARVGIHELLYPILQSYDSVVVGADVELGGTDQKFNILSGRDLMRDRGMESQCALLVPLLNGLDGRKMSKSLGNDIPVACDAEEQFARLMSIADSQIDQYLALVLLESPEARKEAAERIERGGNPRDLKLGLATRIVEKLNGEERAIRARAAWESRFSRGEEPDSMPSVTLRTGMDIPGALRAGGLVSSTSEARRLVREGAVFAGTERVTEARLSLATATVPAEGLVLRIGRRRYLRVVPEGGEA